mmetsp:Transcript_11390/g.42774  ORF Transcript_11390/g.42774 Transcript_11390/m.42774 type:complete len:254 (+) Transcript_11390:44-805(+)
MSARLWDCHVCEIVGFPLKTRTISNLPSNALHGISKHTSPIGVVSQHCTQYSHGKGESSKYPGSRRHLAYIVGHLQNELHLIRGFSRIWVSHINLLLNLECKVTEHSLHIVHGFSVINELGCHSLADLDQSVEAVLIVVHFGECGNCHYLWNSTKVENLPVLQVTHILKHIGHMSESIGDQLIDAFDTFPKVLLILEIFNAVCVERPHVLWPKDTILTNVLVIVANDVGLLQEESHGVGMSRLRLLQRLSLES